MTRPAGRGQGRFSPERPQTISHLQRLNSYKISFHSYTEPHLATDDELVRNILLALLTSMAKLEAQKMLRIDRQTPAMILFNQNKDFSS